MGNDNGDNAASHADVAICALNEGEGKKQSGVRQAGAAKKREERLAALN